MEGGSNHPFQPSLQGLDGISRAMCPFKTAPCSSYILMARTSPVCCRNPPYSISHCPIWVYHPICYFIKRKEWVGQYLLLFLLSVHTSFCRFLRAPVSEALPPHCSFRALTAFAAHCTLLCAPLLPPSRLLSKLFTRVLLTRSREFLTHPARSNHTSAWDGSQY